MCILFGLIPEVGPITGASLSIIDMLFSDKILSGWKPNIFVDNLKNRLIGSNL